MRAIAEYKLEPSGNWLVCLGRDDADGTDTYDELAQFLVTHHAAVAVRPRDGRVTDNAAAGFRSCAVCGSSYWAKRRDSKHCSPTCRQRASRSRSADLAASRLASGAGNAGSSIADLDGADVGDVPTDPREVFGTIHVEPATPRATVKALGVDARHAWRW